jgi:hypothetical protein
MWGGRPDLLTTNWGAAMPGDYHALKAALAAPDLAGLDDAAAAAALAATTTVVTPGTFLTERGVLVALGAAAGDAALTAIEAAATAGNSLLARAVRILHDGAGGGLDFGDPATRAQLDALEAAGVLGPAAVAKLKAVAERTISRAQAIPGWDLPATAADVAHARSL